MRLLLPIICAILSLPRHLEGHGNGNPIALRATPYDEIFPIPNYYPPAYIKERIQTFINFFFDTVDDKAEAEEILVTIWYFSPVFAMLQTVDKMGRHQYAYAEYGDECEDAVDYEDDVALESNWTRDEEKAMEQQRMVERRMTLPTYIYSDDYFFKLDAWWEILGNTMDDLWVKNQQTAAKVCDFRRRGLMCKKDHNGENRCTCGYAPNGVQMVALRGGLCGIEAGNECNYTTGSRLMTTVHKMEVYNALGTMGGSLKTCFGNSYCTGDATDSNRTKCHCWPLITSEIRAKRNALLNKTVGGERCDTTLDEKILKWEKWYVALTVVWVAIPLFVILAPHWDDIWNRVVPGYFKYYKLKKRGVEVEKPGELPRDTYDVKMEPKVKRFIEENSVFVDVNDPDYFTIVDAVDEQELDPLERFITVPHCTDKHYHFEWPTVNKLHVWF